MAEKTKNNTGKLADIVMLQLQKDISGGKYRAGDKIPPEPVLMQQFNVGRSTIREAIKTLAINGILTVQQGSGTMVNTISAKEESLEQRLRRSERKEINEVRMLLEKEIVLLAVRNRTPKDIKKIKEALLTRENLLTNGSYEACLAADINFHQAIAESSHNGILSDLYKTFTKVLSSAISFRDKKSTDRFADNHTFHEALLSYIIARNETKALKTLQEIIQ